jgi:hypothetical protein
VISDSNDTLGLYIHVLLWFMVLYYEMALKSWSEMDMGCDEQFTFPLDVIHK